MQLIFQPKRKATLLVLTIKTDSRQEIMVSVSDPKKPFTDYFKSAGIIEGERKFFVRLPLTPEVALVKIYNVLNGNLPEGVDKTFRLVKIEKQKLEQDLNCFDSANAIVKDYLAFLIPFCERAGYLETGQELYHSLDGRFSIRYLDVIRDNNGNPINSSARVNSYTGVMDYAKYYFRNYTIPERILIATHEFSHFYVNRDARNEFEADRNGLLIYLGLGFPRKEALQGWLKVFGRAQTGQNVRRYKMIEDFVRDFDKNEHKICTY